MATTVWKGHLTFGLISIPVRMFAAARGERVSFNQLHKVCNSRIKQPTFCPVCNRNVERSEIVKGYEYEKDQYVLFNEEELDKIEPPSAKVMEILEFVKTDDIDPLYLDDRETDDAPAGTHRNHQAGREDDDAAHDVLFE